MPELPEVESIRRRLSSAEGWKIKSVRTRDPLVFSGELSPDNCSKYLKGRTIESFDRLGKYLLTTFEHGTLIFSLRMTGKVMLLDECDMKKEHIKLRLDFRNDDRSLFYTSIRRLSRFYWYGGDNLREQKNLARLGPDPLGDDFTWETFKSCFERRQAPIKTLLMDQSFLAGIGNIYASELCYRTGIDPRRPADDLTESEKERLFEAIPVLLNEATEAGGSSFTNFLGADGEPGSFHLRHQVYDRAGDPCEECGNPIQKITLSNRSTFFCDKCQD